MKKLLVLIFLLPTLCVAQSASESYAKSQDEAIAHFKSLAEAVKKSSITQTSLSDNAISYLTAVYLLCMVGNGTCPTVIQGIFETDLLNSIASGNKGCPLMKKFWVTWKDSDMEKRHQFQMSPAHTKRFLAFQKEVLPKYTGCDSTINSILASGSAGIFPGRYTTTGTPESAIFDKIASLLEKIKAKVPNVFVATQSAQTIESEE